MPHLSNALRDWLQKGHRKKELYEHSGLSSGYITNLFDGQLPKPETLGKILATVADEDAAIFLRAYLLDEIPDGWRDRVEIAISEKLEIIRESLSDDPTERRKCLLAWLDRRTEHSEAALKVLEGLYEMFTEAPPAPPK